MKFEEIKNLKTIELIKKRAQLSQEIFDLKMKLSMKRLPNPLKIRNVKRDRARVLTALNKQFKSMSEKK